MTIAETYIAQLQKQYPIYLRHLVSGEQFQVITLRGGKNKPDNAVDLHKAISHFQQLERKNECPGWEIQWEEWSSRKLGNQLWPKTIKVVTEEDLLHLLKKEREVQVFKEQLLLLMRWHPQLQRWLENQPTVILEYYKKWPGIMSVIDYILENDVSGLYLRTLPVPVHTKFIEGNKGVLYSILKALDPDRFSTEGVNLEGVLKLALKPFLFKLRWLDKTKAEELTSGMEVFAVSPNYLQQQQWKLQKVVMVENETNLYLLPLIKDTLAIFTSGKALHLLKEIDFLRRTDIFYWGDLDEDGFEMLHSIRCYYPNVVSLFMDTHTLAKHEKELDVKPQRYKTRALDLLPSEKAAYEILLQGNQWLEQEKLEQSYLQHTLQLLLQN